MQMLFSRWGLIVFCAVIIGCPIAWFALASRQASVALATSRTDSKDTPAAAAVQVEVIKPQRGGIERTTTQPGSVYAFESAKLFAKVSGYLKSQNVDIGDHVKRDQVLAEIDAPELLKEVEQSKAALEQAKSQVLQALARITTARADREAALAAVKKAEANIGTVKAAREYREQQSERIKKLFELDSIDERLVDEQQSQLKSARAAEAVADAEVANARAMASASAARIEQAEADAAEARAKVDVAQAALDKSEVFVHYLKIVSPYDGVVTKRSFFRGDFIRSADQESLVPLLAIDRTDLMRVVVQVPDRDVPFTKPGEDATVEIDALPDSHFSGKVARMADAEDSQTRTMRTEIDLPNPDKTLRQGMYGRVTIKLPSTPGAMAVPSTSLIGSVTDGQGAVYIVKDGVARRVAVVVGGDNGLQIEILRGLSPEDDVILHPSESLADGVQVEAVKQHAESTSPNKLP
jgi:HlyD family secretion protein